MDAVAVFLVCGILLTLLAAVSSHPTDDEDEGDE